MTYTALLAALGLLVLALLILVLIRRNRNAPATFNETIPPELRSDAADITLRPAAPRREHPSSEPASPKISAVIFSHGSGEPAVRLTRQASAGPGAGGDIHLPEVARDSLEQVTGCALPLLAPLPIPTGACLRLVVSAEYRQKLRQHTVGPLSDEPLLPLVVASGGKVLPPHEVNGFRPASSQTVATAIWQIFGQSELGAYVADTHRALDLAGDLFNSLLPFLDSGLLGRIQGGCRFLQRCLQQCESSQATSELLKEADARFDELEALVHDSMTSVSDRLHAEAAATLHITEAEGPSAGNPALYRAGIAAVVRQARLGLALLALRTALAGSRRITCVRSDGAGATLDAALQEASALVRDLGNQRENLKTGIARLRSRLQDSGHFRPEAVIEALEADFGPVIQLAEDVKKLSLQLRQSVTASVPDASSSLELIVAVDQHGHIQRLTRV